MEENIVKILSIVQVTHDVRRFQLEKPEGYTFKPGQATDVSINRPTLKNEKRPFTFTSLNSSDYLEFTIKIYTDHNGITNELGKLKPGAELIVRDVWGDISYKGEGVFIAGGAVRSVVSASGIQNISSKVLGTNNKASNVYATMEALKRLAARYNREQQKRKEKHAV